MRVFLLSSIKSRIIARAKYTAIPDPCPPIVKNRTGQNIILTEQTIIVVSTDAYLALLMDIKNTARIATIMKIKGAIVINGKPAMILDIKASAEATAPKRQTTLSIRESKGKLSVIK